MRPFGSPSEARLRRTAPLFAAVALAAIVPARADILDDPRALGMGTAVRGDPLANTALIYNPAGMSRSYVYAAEIEFFRAGPGDGNAVGINIVDSKTQPNLAVGAAYAYEFTDSKTEPKIDGHNARLGFSHAVLPNQVFMGVGLHYLNVDRTAPLDDTKGFTVDAGALVSLTPAFHLGVVGQNLIDLQDREQPRLAGGGIAYTGGRLTLDFDTMVDFTTQEKAQPVYAVGGELLLGESVPVRLGFERNQASGKSIFGGGLGFMTADEATGGSQFNLAFRQDLGDAKAYHFGVGLAFYL